MTDIFQRDEVYEDARTRLRGFLMEEPVAADIERLIELEERYAGNLGMVIWCREHMQEQREKTTAQMAIVSELSKKHASRRRSLIPKRPTKKKQAIS